MVAFSVLIDDRHGLPQKCPACGESMEQATKALGMYRAFYRLVTEGKLPIRVQTEVVTKGKD